MEYPGLDQSVQLAAAISLKSFVGTYLSHPDTSLKEYRSPITCVASSNKWIISLIASFFSDRYSLISSLALDVSHGQHLSTTHVAILHSPLVSLAHLTKGTGWCHLQISSFTSDITRITYRWRHTPLTSLIADVTHPREELGFWHWHFDYFQCWYILLHTTH